MTPPQFEFVMEARVETGEPLVVGRHAAGLRRIVPILGGEFDGPNLKGRVLPGGADWQMGRTDDVLDLDARYTLKTNAGELIYVRNRGMRTGTPDVLDRLARGEVVDPALYYFRAVPSFETGAAACAWLMRSLFLCVGERRPNEVLLRFWRVV